MSERIFFIILRSILVSFNIVLLFIIPSVVQAENEEIQKIWSPESHITWVGNISGSLSSLSMNVNGRPVESEKLRINNYDNTVHIQITLEYGESNLITIKEGNNRLFSGDVFFAPVYEAPLVPEEYEMRPFHNEENEKPCLFCHRLKTNENDKIPADPSDSICFPCHNQKFSGLAFQHNAAGVNWECLRCHQAEAVETDYSIDHPVKFAIQEGVAVAPLCYQCHKHREKADSEYTYVHGPISQRLCSNCHSPHGSNIENLLQKEVTIMCIECHQKENMLEKPLVHEPVAKHGCTVCHGQHGSNASHLLPAEVNRSCFKCHPKIQKKKNNHPITGHPVSSPKDPTNTDEQLSCISCHDPHSSEFDNLLAEEEVMLLCIRCHPKEN